MEYSQITSVKQHYDQWAVRDNTGERKIYENHVHKITDDWLKVYGLEVQKLTLADFAREKERYKTEGDLSETGTSDHKKLLGFGTKLMECIGNYHRRTEWLLTGSRKLFGLVHGQNIAILIDMSDNNCSCGRLVTLQDSLLKLIDEQLTSREGFYIMPFGTYPRPQFRNIRSVNHRSLDDTRQFVKQLQPLGGCNLIGALKLVLKKRKQFDSIIIILGGSPDQPLERVSDYISQAVVGLELPLHVVAFDCIQDECCDMLQQIAEVSKGRYHCYSSRHEEEIFVSTDIALLKQELDRGVEVMMSMKSMQAGLLSDALEENINKLSTLVAATSDSTADALSFNSNSSTNTKSSREWLKENGLRAQKLSIYQLLEPNSFQPTVTYVPILKKEIRAHVYDSMIKFQWPDGSERRVHIDPATFTDYTASLQKAADLFKSRELWLRSGSRKTLGVIAEKRVTIFIETSTEMAKSFNRLKKDLKLLFEEQLIHTHAFNVICIGSKVRAWTTKMVETSKKSLQECYRWITTQECHGRLNLLEGLKFTIELHLLDTSGMYLIACSKPDQPIELVMSYLQQRLLFQTLPLHCIYYDISQETESIIGNISKISMADKVLCNLAHATTGRFHVYRRDQDVVEGDDVEIIRKEIERTNDFCEKAEYLLQYTMDKVNTKRAGFRSSAINYTEVNEKSKTNTLPKRIKSAPSKISSSKTPSTSKNTSSKAKRQNQTAKVKPWKPSGPSDPAYQNYPEWFSGKKTKKAQLQPFYIGSQKDKKDIGYVYVKYPDTHKEGKNFACNIPNEEESLSSKEWLKKYSLSKLYLDFDKWVIKRKTKSSNAAKVSQDQCTVSLTLVELKNYQAIIAKVFKRYLTRLNWLLTGSRRVFGVIMEKNMTILLDASGSMESYFKQLKQALMMLIWEQMMHRKCFNIVQFSNEINSWKSRITTADDNTCMNACNWISKLNAIGNTNILDALEYTFKQDQIEAIYIISDGMTDNPSNMILRKVKEWRSQKPVAIHTIAYCCEKRSATEFLRQLAHQNNGRYHEYNPNMKNNLEIVNQLADNNYNINENEIISTYPSDDAKKLLREIMLAKEFHLQASTHMKLRSPNKS